MAAEAALSALTSTFSSAAYQALGKDTVKARAMAAAQDFEAVYLADAFKDMFKGVSVDPLSGVSDSSNETWRDMLVDEYAKDLAKHGGIGIADGIAGELIKIQEGKSA